MKIIDKIDFFGISDYETVWLRYNSAEHIVRCNGHWLREEITLMYICKIKRLVQFDQTLFLYILLWSDPKNGINDGFAGYLVFGENGKVKLLSGSVTSNLIMLIRVNSYLKELLVKADIPL